MGPLLRKSEHKSGDTCLPVSYIKEKFLNSRRLSPLLSCTLFFCHGVISIYPKNSLVRQKIKKYFFY